MGFKNLISFDAIVENEPFFLDLDEHPDWSAVFGNRNPIKLEVGFGGGSFLIEMAARENRANFVGLDYYHKGIRKTITRINKLQLQNVRLVYGDAKEKIPLLFRRGELSEVYINFPDPWPKKRHAKRRLIKPEIIGMLAEKIAPGGTIYLATDSESYAAEILEGFEASPEFTNKSGPRAYEIQREDVPKSKYEKNFIKAGEKIFYMTFMRN
ncbi:MAG: tRNA (guanosine(46)-N7)-methyltransferase TrmB [Nitrospinae bacterium CG11_big_fil_rev_8_21_14_0_20_56_8]|nr:MAG: tRNA (guanosine(46)-N7)-methyltransferase TrmB [Nitrospinae bacterium CG11_big_fil_rev_8_21_14_0_20_56_8]